MLIMLPAVGKGACCARAPCLCASLLSRNATSVHALCGGRKVNAERMRHASPDQGFKYLPGFFFSGRAAVVHCEKHLQVAWEE